MHASAAMRPATMYELIVDALCKRKPPKMMSTTLALMMRRLQYVLIRLAQSDVWNDTNEWKEFLQAKIEVKTASVHRLGAEYERGMYKRLRTSESFF